MYSCHFPPQWPPLSGLWSTLWSNCFDLDPACKTKPVVVLLRPSPHFKESHLSLPTLLFTAVVMWPGRRASLQTHLHRCRHWIAVLHDGWVRRASSASQNSFTLLSMVVFHASDVNVYVLLFMCLCLSVRAVLFLWFYHIKQHVSWVSWGVILWHRID